MFLSHRISFIYVDRGSVNVQGHAMVHESGEQVVAIPVARMAVVMLGPGVTVSHAAVRLAADAGALLIWVGEHGVRFYSAGDPRGNGENIVRQAMLFSTMRSRLTVVRRLFALMFDEDAPPRRSIEQIRGLEGSRVKRIYGDYAGATGVSWDGRNPTGTDATNRALSSATASLYGITEAVIVALGFSPTIGFSHHGNARSFVFDLADTVKFRTVVPLAFDVVSKGSENVERRVRSACRDLFFQDHIVDLLVSNLKIALDAQ